MALTIREKWNKTTELAEKSSEANDIIGEVILAKRHNVDIDPTTLQRLRNRYDILIEECRVLVAQIQAP